ncbi:MAG: flavodoxin family protein [Planctomycetaceae bacterium]|jgi:multimeric flavodoxin WrbA|nr:flavodoxin family protein [Planctomycetaceae bacterium]
MKIIAINGSPRKNWNTDSLLRKALEGAASQNAETEIVHLYDLKYKGCISCFACKIKDGSYTCALQDDLTSILEKLKSADAIIFGSPIYFMNVTSGTSSFLERFFFPYIKYSKETPSLFPKKLPTGFIYTMNITKEQLDESKINLNPYEMFIEMVLGEKPMLLYSYNTYQYSDYNKYESSMFDEKEKSKYRAEQFPLDCQTAFEMGKSLAKNAEMNKVNL